MADSQSGRAGWIVRRVILVASPFFLLLVVLFAVAAASNANDSSHHHNEGDRPVRELPECPVVWEAIPLQGERLFNTQGRGLSVSGPRTNVPEFHDCQRFMVPNTDAELPGPFMYDSVYAIFAHHGGRAGADFVMTSLRDSLMALRDRRVPARALAVAEIYSFGGTYPQLGLKPDFNCLFVYMGQAGLEAVMANVGAEEPACGRPANPDTIVGKHLKVLRDTVPGFKASDYPNAARWDWSSEGNQQYIGIGCDDGWCEVGDSSFKPSPPYPLGATSSEADRVVRVKGWYDEQYLADTQPKLHPARVKATVIPHPRLKNHVFPKKTWDTVAYIALDGPSALYEEKFGFAPAAVSTSLGTMNRVEICYDRRGSCEVPRFGEGAVFCGNLDRVFWWLPLPNMIWWVKYTPAGNGTPKYRCIKRRTHEDAQGQPVDLGAPGTVRWRFINNDETNWFDCREGCCETEVAN